MKITSAAFQRYSVPFKVPFTTSHGQEQHRRGILLRIKTEDGLTGYGETVALPSFGTATLDQLERCLAEIVSNVEGKRISEAHQIAADLSSQPEMAPARFALDTALLDIEAIAAGLPLARYLSEDAVLSVPINATISDMDPDGAAMAAVYAVTAGYEAIKMKVGVYGDPDLEVKRVAAVREAIGPGTALRLDVNSGWSLEYAVEVAKKLEPYNIDYLEQPLPASDIGAMAQLRSRVGIPIAADEAATSPVAVQEMLELNAVDVIVIKSTIVGGITAAREMIDIAGEAGLRIVVTTAIETGIGITAALHLAATLPKPIPPCGLATATLLESDLLVESPRIRAGRMKIPDRPGLGVEPLATLWAETG
jgi:L-Ala-D/L-Glu epimerase